MRGHNPCVFTKYGVCVVKIMDGDCYLMHVFLLAVSTFPCLHDRIVLGRWLPALVQIQSPHDIHRQTEVKSRVQLACSVKTERVCSHGDRGN